MSDDELRAENARLRECLVATAHYLDAIGRTRRVEIIRAALAAGGTEPRPVQNAGFRVGWLAALSEIQGFAGLTDDERLAIDRAYYDNAMKRAQGIVPEDEAGRR